MGRPISNYYIGSGAGNQLQISSCWIPGEGSANTSSYIVKQIGQNRYIAKNSSTNATGIVQLQQASVTAAGQAQIVVTPWAAQGSGATATARCKVLSASIQAAGSGYTNGTYTATVTGGTSTTAAQLTVTVSGNVVTAVSVATPGVYSALPSNPVSCTGITGGTGATFNLTWGVDSIVLGSGGSNYNAVTVAISGGLGATATATVSSGVVQTPTVTNAGSGYTAVPGVTISPAASTETARIIMLYKVRTWEGNVYTWSINGGGADAKSGTLPLA